MTTDHRFIKIKDTYIEADCIGSFEVEGRTIVIYTKKMYLKEKYEIVCSDIAEAYRLLENIKNLFCVHVLADANDRSYGMSKTSMMMF